MKLKLVSAMMAAVLTLTGNATVTFVKFSGLLHGQHIENQALEQGEVFTSSSNGSIDGVQVYAGDFIFRNDPDQDLIFDGIGVIIPERTPTANQTGRLLGIVDDERRGGVINLDLNTAANFLQFVNIDQDNDEVNSFSLFLGDDLVYTETLDPNGNGGQEVIQYSSDRVFDRVEWKLSGSGAVGNIGYMTAIPEPSTALLISFAMLGLLRRKR